MRCEENKDGGGGEDVGDGMERWEEEKKSEIEG